MKKIIILAVIILAFLGVVAAGARLFTPEDSWVCSDFGWQKHGAPSSPLPKDKSCAIKKVKIFFGNEKLKAAKNSADVYVCGPVFLVEREVNWESMDLKLILNLLFAGPSDEEKLAGYNSLFSSATAGALNDVKIENQTV